MVGVVLLQVFHCCAFASLFVERDYCFLFMFFLVLIEPVPINLIRPLSLIEQVHFDLVLHPRGNLTTLGTFLPI